MAKTQSGDEAVHIAGIRALLKALNKIPKDLQANVRDASQSIAGDLVAGARNAARTPLQSMVAGGLVAKRDRVPVVKTSGMVRAGVPTRHVFYGAEFGGGRRPTTRQFLPHKGQTGYFLYPYARAHGDDFADRWADAVDKAFRDWDNQTARHGGA